MQKFRVYHKKEMMFRYNEADAMTFYDPDLYYWVANVRTRNIGDVFRVTNHIDEAWWENPEIFEYNESRSTSVGDVVFDVAAGTYHLCMPAGWKELNTLESGESWMAIDFEDNVFRCQPTPKFKMYDEQTHVYTSLNPYDGVEYVIKRTYTHPKANWECVHPY